MEAWPSSSHPTSPRTWPASPCCAGVSFKLERRDRLTIAGRNGAGKTTLLRMLAGETSIDGGELVFQKGVRVALHDQRPPRERDAHAARLRAVGAAREPLELEAELGAPRAGDGRRRRGGDGPLLRRLRALRGRRRLRLARARQQRSCTASASPTTRPRPPAARRSPAASSRARRWPARWPREPDLLLLDEPTNHLDIESLEWLEQTLVGLDAAIVLVAHDRWFLEAVGTAVLELEAGRTRFFNGHVGAVAQGAGRARDGARQGDREAAGRDRAAWRRFVERFRCEGDEGQAGPVAPEAPGQDRAHRARPARRRASSASSSRSPSASGRVIFELEDGRLRGRRRPAAGAARRRRDVARARRARLARRAQRDRQDDAHRGAGRRAARSTAASCARATTSRSATSASTTTSSRARRRAHGRSRPRSERTGLTPNQARALLGRFLFSGEEAEKPLDGLCGRRAQAPRRWRSSSRAARTS